MNEGNAQTEKRSNKSMRAVVHTHKDSYEAMKAFTEKRATMAIGYIRDCSAAEIKYLRHELCKGTAGA